MGNATVSTYCSLFAQGRIAGPPQVIKQSYNFALEVVSPLDPYRNKWYLSVYVAIPRFKKYEPVQGDIVAVKGDLVIKYSGDKTYLNLYQASIDGIIRCSENKIEPAPDETKNGDEEQPKQSPEPQTKPQEAKKAEQKPPVKPTPPPAQNAHPKQQEKAPAKPPVKIEPPKIPEVYSFEAVEKYQKELEEYNKQIKLRGT